MKFRKVLIAAAACFSLGGACAAGPPVEVASQAGPHGTAPREWLQRLAKAGAGSTRLVTAGASTQPRLDDLGALPGGKPLVKVHAVLTRRNELLLPGAEGPRRFRASDTKGLAEYFQQLEAGGAAGVTTPRGKHGLTKEEFTDLFTRLGKPFPRLMEGATLGDAVAAVERAARVTIDVDPTLGSVLKSKAEGAAALEGLATGSALAAILRQEALALVPEPPAPGSGTPRARGRATTKLSVQPSNAAKEPWPVGYDPEGSPTQTAPGLMEFLTVEVEGYTLAEALEAIGPRVTWKGRPIPIVWDRFVMRRDAIDPTTVEVHFARKRTFYKKLLDQLAFQARLDLQLRVDETGRPFLWMTR